ncbi:MAG: hypothetical protein ACLTOV_08465 [Phocaeicola sp.]
MIELKSLNKSFEGKNVLNDINFSFEKLDSRNRVALLTQLAV